MKILKMLNVRTWIMILMLTMLAGCGRTKMPEETTEAVSEEISETASTDNVSTEADETYMEFVEGLDEADVEALRSIIEEQNAQGASVNTDLRNTEIYTWDSDGRLTGIRWSSNDLRGTISFEGLTKLKFLECRYTQLEGLDVSDCSALQSLDCRSNQLKSLDVSSCTELTWLDCEGNMLENLNLSGCTQMSTLYCDYNQLSSLDISSCTELTWLACGNNLIESLDVSKCTQLSTLYCDDNVVITGQRPE